MAQLVLYTRGTVSAEDSIVTLKRAGSDMAVNVGESTENVSVNWRIL